MRIPGDFVQSHATAEYSLDPRWPGAVLRFNLNEASYAHLSWLPTSLAAPASGGRYQYQYAAALSAGLRDEVGVAGLYDWSIDSAAARLFLMDAGSLATIALIVGIAAHRQTLRQVVQGQQIELLGNQLGTALDTLWFPLAQAVPAAETALLLPWNMPSNRENRELKPALVEEGQRQLLRLVDTKQRASAMRAALCMSRSVAKEPLPCLSAVQAQTMTDTIIEHAVTQWTPQWTWLF
jgi:hypothetical protein